MPRPCTGTCLHSAASLLLFSGETDTFDSFGFLPLLLLFDMATKKNWRRQSRAEVLCWGCRMKTWYQTIAQLEIGVEKNRESVEWLLQSRDLSFSKDRHLPLPAKWLPIWILDILALNIIASWHLHHILANLKLPFSTSQNLFPTSKCRNMQCLSFLPFKGCVNNRHIWRFRVYIWIMCVSYNQHLCCWIFLL